jgi:hypothetical protein
MTQNTRLGLLSSNQLKLIALIAMTLDHIGKQLLPQYPILQIIGRLAFPIFAYMIAEGCKYTRNRKRYFATIFIAGLLCQIVYYIAMESLYLCVLITFSLSILIIFAIDYAIEPIREWHNMVKHYGAYKNIMIIVARCILPIVLICAVVYACEELPDILWRKYFDIDYGIWGVLMPVVIYYGKGKLSKLVLSAIMITLLAMSIEGIQWYSLFALIPLLLYNGRRGKLNMKNLFYVYYPLHLVVIYGIYLLIQ